MDIRRNRQVFANVSLHLDEKPAISQLDIEQVIAEEDTDLADSLTS